MKPLPSARFAWIFSTLMVLLLASAAAAAASGSAPSSHRASSSNQTPSSHQTSSSNPTPSPNQMSSSNEASSSNEGVAPPDDPSRIARWNALREAVFGKRPVAEGSAVIQMEVPTRALDAALMPLSLTITGGHTVKGVYLFIDNNPSPLAGRFVFGPAADPSSLKMRVRINEYTLVHAVAETRDSMLFGTQKFVKAAGGCSAPAGTDEAEALKEMGRMKLRLLGEFAPGKPMQALLQIHHPNFNGMQMNQVTRMYTPARFIRTLDVSYSGEPVLHVESDISMSENPAITFGFVPRSKGTLEVKAVDSTDAQFAQAFEVPATAAPSVATTAPAPQSSVAEPEDFWLGPANGPVPGTLTGATVIRAKYLATLLKQRRPVVIDVSNSQQRPEKLAPQAVWMPPPHPVIPGSLWIAGAGAGAIDANVEKIYRQRLAEATANNLHHPVVLYCHERCWLSWNAAKRAIRYGYRNVYWFPDGIEGWRVAGFETANVETPAASMTAATPPP